MPSLWYLQRLTDVRTAPLPLLIVSCLVFASVPLSAGAYTQETHGRLIEEAFHFMGQHTDNYRDILELWPSTMHRDVRLSDRLVSGANAADTRADLYYRRTSRFGRIMGFFLGIDECFQYLEVPFGYKGHFTAMQHFLVLPRGPGKIWRYDGYAYQTSDKKGDDFLAFGFPLVYYSHAKIDIKQCGGGGIPSWFERGVKPVRLPQLRKNLEQELPYVIYPPATSLAEYDYDEFLKDIAPDFPRPGIPGLESLARVLHLAQDMTVPHHVVGVLGSGHTRYEGAVEGWLNTRRHELVDDVRIRHFLEEGRCLQLQCQLTDIFMALADYTIQFERREGRVDKNNVYMLSNITTDNAFRRAQELVNLAIAANVAILKAAWKDWAGKHPLQAQLLTVTGKGAERQAERERLKRNEPSTHEAQKSQHDVHRDAKDAAARASGQARKVPPPRRKDISPLLRKDVSPPRTPEYQEVADRFGKVPIKEMIHIPLPEDRQVPFERVLIEVRDKIRQFFSDPNASHEEFITQIDGDANNAKQILHGVKEEEIREAFKKRLALPTHRYERSGQQDPYEVTGLQEAYDSMEFCMELVLFRFVLDAFPPPDYLHLRKSWVNAISLLPKYVKNLPTDDSSLPAY